MSRFLNVWNEIIIHVSNSLFEVLGIQVINLFKTYRKVFRFGKGRKIFGTL